MPKEGESEVTLTVTSAENIRVLYRYSTGIGFQVLRCELSDGPEGNFKYMIQMFGVNIFETASIYHASELDDLLCQYGYCDCTPYCSCKSGSTTNREHESIQYRILVHVYSSFCIPGPSLP
jgi:hypothetical protein